MKKMLFVTVVLFSCGGEKLGGLQPRVTICLPPNTGADCREPSMLLLDFGESGAGAEPSLQKVYIYNTGEAELAFPAGGVEITEGQDTFSLGDVPSSIGAGGLFEMQVGFRPLEVGEYYSGRIELASNDPRRRKVEVLLAGKGVRVPAPDIEVCAPPETDPECLQPEELKLEFGEVGTGREKTQPFRVRNRGDADLLVREMKVAAVTGEGFSLQGDVPASIPPGESTFLFVLFAPASSGDAAATLKIETNDPDEPEVLIGTHGTATGNEAPHAVAKERDSGLEEASVDPLSTVFLDGTASSDPEGGALTYTWIFENGGIPERSAASLFNSDTAYPSFFADLVGQYRVSLVVADSFQAASEPDTVTISALPSTDMHVQLTWDGAGDNLDLHVVRPGGVLWSQDDCFWENCADPQAGPDWGAAGDQSDNPAINADRTNGPGPEDISLNSPEDGVFTVYVQLMNDADPATAAYVLVTLNSGAGIELKSADCAGGGILLRSRCDVWKAGEVNFNQENVTTGCTIENRCR